MTCIIGATTPNGAIFCSDSASIDGDFNLRAASTSKVFYRTDEKKTVNVMFGSAGNWRGISVVKHSKKPLPKIKDNLDRWIEIDLVEYIRGLYKEDGIHGEKGEESPSLWLVSVGNQLFEIDGYYTVNTFEDLPYAAIGCGSDLALGALAVLHEQNMDIKDKLTKAMQVASKFSGGVCAPFKLNHNIPLLEGEISLAA